MTGTTSTLSVHVHTPDWPTGRQRYRLYVDGDVAGEVRSDGPPLVVEVEPGRRSVQARSIHGMSESAVLSVEVLTGDTVPLAVGLNELGLSGDAVAWRMPRLFLRRTDNDPGRRTP